MGLKKENKKKTKTDGKGFNPYFFRLSSEEQEYLMDHPDGNICWQTDYRLLRERFQETAYNNFIEDVENQKLNSRIEDVF
jgi:hypothetical protein